MELREASDRLSRAEQALARAEEEHVAARDSLHHALAERGWRRLGLVRGDLWEHSSRPERTFETHEALDAEDGQ